MGVHSVQAADKGQSALLALRERACRTVECTVCARFLGPPSISPLLDSLNAMCLNSLKTEKEKKQPLRAAFYYRSKSPAASG